MIDGSEEEAEMGQEEEVELEGVVIAGHGVASGRAERERFPEGTLALQIPEFLERGLDLRPFWRATINVSIAPLCARLLRADYSFPNVGWDPQGPAEDFSFLRCRLLFETKEYPAMLYYPHPDTKPGHFQSPSTLEVLSMRIPELRYGSMLRLWLPKDALYLYAEA